MDKGADANGLSASTSRPPVEAKTDVEENVQTIRPTRSPGSRSAVLKTPPLMKTIIEDYSDLGGEDEDMQLERKVASFRVRICVLCVFVDPHVFSDEEWIAPRPLPPGRHPPHLIPSVRQRTSPRSHSNKTAAPTWHTPSTRTFTPHSSACICPYPWPPSVRAASVPVPATSAFWVIRTS
jgi:hypothetical protein